LWTTLRFIIGWYTRFGRPKHVVHTLHSLDVWCSVEILILFLQTTHQRVLFSEQ